MVKKTFEGWLRKNSTSVACVFLLLIVSLMFGTLSLYVDETKKLKQLIDNHSEPQFDYEAECVETIDTTYLEITSPAELGITCEDVCSKTEYCVLYCPYAGQCVPSNFDETRLDAGWEANCISHYCKNGRDEAVMQAVLNSQLIIERIVTNCTKYKIELYDDVTRQLTETTRHVSLSEVNK